MRAMSLSDVTRTAFKYYENDPAFPSLSKDINKVCPYCKNADTDIIKDEAYLQVFKQFYKEKTFTALSCFCCNAVWSYSKCIKAEAVDANT